MSDRLSYALEAERDALRAALAALYQLFRGDMPPGGAVRLQVEAALEVAQPLPCSYYTATVENRALRAALKRLYEACMGRWTYEAKGTTSADDEYDILAEWIDAIEAAQPLVAPTPAPAEATTTTK